MEELQNNVSKLFCLDILFLIRNNGTLLERMRKILTKYT